MVSEVNEWRINLNSHGVPESGEEKIAAYYHQCNSDETSYYNREDILCDGANKPSVTNNFKTVRCRSEWVSKPRV